MDLFNGFSEQEVEELIALYYSGSINEFNLPEAVYLATVNRITDAIIEGFGSGDFDELPNERGLLEHFEYNAQRFSAAKTYQEAKTMTSLLVDAEGIKVPFNKFAEQAAKVTTIFNDNWLRTEYTTAITSAYSGRQWLDNVRDMDVAPLLKYQTVLDDRVRAAHVALDNIVKPVEDPFWNTRYPPNGWNCRCIAEALTFDELEPITHNDQLPPISDVPPIFRNNPGKSQEIFTEDGHPYFDAPKDVKRKDFGLPVMKRPNK